VIEMGMAPVPIVVPICVVTFSDVICPSVQSGLRGCFRRTRGRSHRGTIAREARTSRAIDSTVWSRKDARSCSRHTHPAREARASGGKVWIPPAEASCRKAEGYAAAAAATTKATAVETATGETSTPVEASTTVEASSTTESSSTSTVTSRPRDRAECE